MSSILEIFFPLCASDTVRWQRRTPDVEHGIWPDVADEQCGVVINSGRSSCSLVEPASLVWRGVW
ncbi:hypothetical protein MU123_003182 [Escherichia coli]|nr:hypothetical protein [Escherichia coli]EJG8123525.1 hypothetical protein [Escherichia coli]EKP6553492.1 hypothetical protein [Escherichia coli]ELA3979335.1 hypothetical protein [Escherichia coli]